MAIAGSPSRPTAITGTRTAFFTSLAKSRNGASGMAIGGIITCAGRQRTIVAGADVQGVGARVSRPDRDLLALVPRQAAREIILDRQPVDHRHVVDRSLDGAQHLEPEAGAVLEAAAVLVIDAPVLERCVELRDQVAVRGVDLDAIEARALGARQAAAANAATVSAMRACDISCGTMVSNVTS
mgnify:CR=1 FL=1